MSDARYKRVVVKISGESLSSGGRPGIESAAAGTVADEIAKVVELGTQLGLVVGAGNFIRGGNLDQTPVTQRMTADSMGMLATVINALALADVLEDRGVPARVTSAMPMPAICEQFVSGRAIRHLQEGRVVLLAGGTGNPFFTTDTCAALRALQLEAELVIKATKVVGVFVRDPVKNPGAKKFERLTYAKVLAEALEVMDLPAVAMSMGHKLPIIVCKLDEPGSVAAAVRGEQVGTRVEG